MVAGSEIRSTFALLNIFLEMSNVKKGYIFGIIGAALYGSNPLFALPLYDMDMDVGHILLWRYLIAIVFMAGVLIIRKESFKISLKETALLFGMGVFFSTSSFSLFKSYEFMAAGLATAIQFVYPAMVVVLMSLCLKERMTLKTVTIIFMTLAGVLMLYDGNDTTLSLTGLLLVLLSALSYAIYLVGVNLSVLKDMSLYKLSFYTFVFGLLLYVINIQATSTFTLPPPRAWFYLFEIAALPSAVSLIFIAISFRLIGSTKTSILGVFEPLTAVLIGTFVYHEEMTPRIAMGVVIIIVAVCALTISKKEKKIPQPVRVSTFSRIKNKNKL